MKILQAKNCLFKCLLTAAFVQLQSLRRIETPFTLQLLLLAIFYGLQCLYFGKLICLHLIIYNIHDTP